MVADAQKLPIFADLPSTRLGEERIWNVMTMGDVIRLPRLHHHHRNSSVTSSYRRDVMTSHYHQRSGEFTKLPKLKPSTSKPNRFTAVENQRKLPPVDSSLPVAVNSPMRNLSNSAQMFDVWRWQERPLTESGYFHSTNLHVALTTTNKDQVAEEIEKYLKWKEQDSIERVSRQQNKAAAIQNNKGKKKAKQQTSMEKSPSKKPSLPPTKVGELPPILEVHPLHAPTDHHRKANSNKENKQKMMRKKKISVVGYPKKFEKLNWRLPANKTTKTIKQQKDKNFIHIISTSASIDLGSMTSQNMKSTLQVSIAVARKPNKKSRS